MKFKRILVWFRNDLRLHDHEVLSKAIEHGGEVVPVYCLDPRLFSKTDLGFPKTGTFRTKFLFEAIEDLQNSLKKIGADLVILEGKPEEVLVDFAIQHQIKAVFFSKEVTSEERNVDKSVERLLFSNGIACESFWQSTLFHLDDLPFPVKQTPEIFTQFRKELEKSSSIRKEFRAPNRLNFPNEVMESSLKEIPTLKSYGLDEPKQDEKSWLEMKGGESSALGRLQSYFWEKDLLKSYKQTRNGLLGMDYSSKFSPWLALGCISPRKIYHEVRQYEKERIKNDSTYWLIFELIWRDYFRFIAKKHGNKIFKIEGIKNQKDSWRRDPEIFRKWMEGRTGVPFVDANMRELRYTGFMSNRGRQNVASFLVNDLGIDWTWGASYFESQLMDFDVCSNWGNWMYVAGVGNDPRENRYFNILKQGKNYDSNGDYVRYWIPELRKIQGFMVHQPWKLSTQELKGLKVQIGNSYPHPIVASFTNISI